MIHEPRPDDDALDASCPALRNLLLEHLRLSLEEEQRELDCWNEEVDEAERTGDHGSTARQCETIRQGCAQLLGISQSEGLVAGRARMANAPAQCRPRRPRPRAGFADMKRRLNTQTWTIVGTLVVLGALLVATNLWD